MTVTVRRVTEDDWMLLRTVRREMLADTPQAYLETVADADARSEADWQFRALRGSSGPTDLALAADDPAVPDRWVGYLACFVDAPGQGHVVSVYVAPSHRGTGLAGQMIDGVVGWARGEAALNRLHLHVHEDNSRARAFYRRYGFTETGGGFPYDLDPTKTELEMALLID